jgi:hypothetical protein
MRTERLEDGESSAKNAIGTVALLAASALLVPWQGVLMAAAFGVGGVCLAIGIAREVGGSAGTDPSRCPTCQRDELLRVQAATCQTRIPLLLCRACGTAYRWWGGTLTRDDGRCQLP